MAAFFYFYKKWKIEAYFLLASFAAMGVASTALKYVYQRPRPSIQWLIDTIGYSFPSWHTASTMMIAGAIVIVLQQRMKKGIGPNCCASTSCFHFYIGCHISYLYWGTLPNRYYRRLVTGYHTFTSHVPIL